MWRNLVSMVSYHTTPRRLGMKDPGNEDTRDEDNASHQAPNFIKKLVLSNELIKVELPR